MANLKLDIDALNALQLAGKANSIVASLTDNPAFPTPAPTLTVISDQAAALTTAHTLQRQREAEAISATRDTETAAATLRGSLRTLGGYVQTTSGGDAAKILSSGFQIEKDRTPAAPLHAPSGINAGYGDAPGEIDLVWTPLHGRPTYEVHVAESDDGPWRYAVSSTRGRARVTGLTSGSLYHLKVRGMNAAGPGAFSNPLTQRAS